MTLNGTTRRSSQSSNGRQPARPPDHHHAITRQVAEIVKLEQRDQRAMTLGDRIANRLTAFYGSMIGILLHVILFTAWPLVNLGWPGVEPFDPLPFNLLGMLVGIEAIFLSSFVLMSQNRQAQQADRRAKINLQIDSIAEQEITKIMQMLIEIHDRLGIAHEDDQELHAMQQRRSVVELADEIDAAEQRLDPHGAQGPDSAVDTEA